MGSVGVVIVCRFQHQRIARVQKSMTLFAAVLEEILRFHGKAYNGKRIHTHASLPSGTLQNPNETVNPCTGVPILMWLKKLQHYHYHKVQ
jgi:hypothetical protein